MATRAVETRPGERKSGENNNRINPGSRRTRLRAFRGARRHMDVFISFRLVDHDGPVGMEHERCSCRSPSKLAVSFVFS